MKKLVLTFMSLLAVLICSAQSEVNVNVVDAGTLGSLLGDKKTEITKLTVTGKINGDDIAVLRTLTYAALRDLDLKDANIVAGGGSNDVSSDGTPWYTEDNKIPAHIFDQCNLKSIALPESATVVGEYAFNSCPLLANVTFGSKLKTIEPYAFYYCEQLTEVNFSDYIEEIGNNSFANCKNISNIHFPLNLKSIGTMSFMSCEMLQEVILPEGMISLGMAAFFNAKGVKKAVLPASLSNIEAKAFSNCESLAEIYEYAINIPTFGANVFNGVDKNTCIVYVPTGMANDYSECPAFVDFVNIQEFNTSKRDVTVTVTEPGTLKTLLGEGALKTIERLTIKGKINNDDLKVLTTMTRGADYITGEREYNLSFIDMQDVDIVAGGENNLVDGQVCAASDNTLTGYTFNYCNGLQEIILPKSLEVIGDGAFNGVESLTEVTLYNKVREIGGVAFYETSISRINIPEGVEMIAMSTFSSCTKLASVTLPSTLKIIESMAFMNCKSLQEIKIPEGMTTLGTGAFYGCEALKKVFLPSTFNDTGSKSFSLCYAIEEIHVKATTPPSWNKKPFAYIYESAHLYVPKGCIEVYKNSIDNEGNGWGAFWNIEEEQEEQGEDPTDLNKPVFVDGIYYKLYPENKTAVVTYGNKNDEECKCTPEYEKAIINIPSAITFENEQYTVKGIDKDAFRYDKILTEITLPATIDSIGESAFKLCYGLTKVTLPANLQKIGRHAFFSCYQLKEFNIPNEVSTIEEGAFAYCSAIESITFPEKTTTLDADVFKGCEGLKAITFHDGLTSIGGYAFSECSKIESIVLPESVESLGEGSFESCWNLQEIVLPSKIKVIPSSAFLYCKSVKNIVIPETVERIEMYAFSNCKAATNVTIGSNVQYIGVNAFELCPIETLRFEDGTTPCVLESEMMSNYGEISAFEDIKLKNIYIGREVQNFVRWNKNYVEELTFGPGMSVWYDDYCGTTATKVIAKMADPAQMVPNFDGNVYQNAQLVVPVGMADTYAAAEGWKNFRNIVDENGTAASIDNIVEDFEDAEYYTIDGMRIQEPVKGVNIIKTKNGKVKKVIIE